MDAEDPDDEEVVATWAIGVAARAREQAPDGAHSSRTASRDGATRAQSPAEAGPEAGLSAVEDGAEADRHFRGVFREASSGQLRWHARIYLAGALQQIGTFASSVEAARAYDRAAVLHGRTPNFEAGVEAPQPDDRPLHGVRAECDDLGHTALIELFGHRFNLGTFPTAGMAAAVYNAFARQHGLPLNPQPLEPLTPDAQQALVGRRACVYWRKERAFFDGVLKWLERSEDEPNPVLAFHIEYDDGDSEDGIELNHPEVVLVPSFVVGPLGVSRVKA